MVSAPPLSRRIWYILRNSRHIATNDTGAKDPVVSVGVTVKADQAAKRVAVVMQHILSESRLIKRTNCPR